MANKIQQEGIYRVFTISPDADHKSSVTISGREAEGFINMLVSDKTTKTNSIVNQVVIGVAFDAKININEDSDDKELLGLLVGDMIVRTCHKVDKQNTHSRFTPPYDDIAFMKDLIRSAVYPAYAEQKASA